MFCANLDPFCWPGHIFGIANLVYTVFYMWDFFDFVIKLTLQKSEQHL